MERRGGRGAVGSVQREPGSSLALKQVGPECPRSPAENVLVPKGEQGSRAAWGGV